MRLSCLKDNAGFCRFAYFVTQKGMTAERPAPLMAPCTVSAHRPGKSANDVGICKGSKRTLPSGSAQHRGRAVPATEPSGAVNQNDTFSPGMKPVASNTMVPPGFTWLGVAVPFLPPPRSQLAAGGVVGRAVGWAVGWLGGVVG